MIMEKRLSVTLVICIILVGVSGYLFAKTSTLEKEIAKKNIAIEEAKKEINLPIGSQDAIDIAKVDQEFITFASKYFRDPNLRVELASLQLDERFGYVWKVEFIERACGCAGIENLTSMEFYIDPETGEILKKEKNIGVSEEFLARKNCEKGCH
jgi:hypothetical protein